MVAKSRLVWWDLLGSFNNLNKGFSARLFKYISFAVTYKAFIATVCRHLLGYEAAVYIEHCIIYEAHMSVTKPTSKINSFSSSSAILWQFYSYINNLSTCISRFSQLLLIQLSNFVFIIFRRRAGTTRTGSNQSNKKQVQWL